MLSAKEGLKAEARCREVLPWGNRVIAAEDGWPRVSHPLVTRPRRAF